MNADAFDVFNIADVYRNIAWALGPTVVAFAILLFLRLRKLLSGGPAAPSEEIQKTQLASFDGGLPLDLRLIAGVGRNAEAPQTFKDKYLRPTIGLRLIMFGFPVALFWILQSMQTIQGLDLGNDGITLILAAVMFVLMVHNIIYFNVYELRYDDTRIVHRTWLYQRRELLMSRLLNIRDDGMYFYIVHCDDGKKAYVPKHLIGIEDFLRSVRASISKNEAY